MSLLSEENLEPEGLHGQAQQTSQMGPSRQMTQELDPHPIFCLIANQVHGTSYHPGKNREREPRINGKCAFNQQVEQELEIEVKF